MSINNNRIFKSNIDLNNGSFIKLIFFFNRVYILLSIWIEVSIYKDLQT